MLNEGGSSPQSSSNSKNNNQKLRSQNTINGGAGLRLNSLGSIGPMNSSQGMNPNEGGGNPFAIAASSNAAGDGNSKLGHWGEVQRLNGQLEFQIEDLDKKLNRVLAKQEYEYLKGYNIYVKQKEKDLRELIEKLNEKNSNNTLKDEKISKLESTIGAIREDQIRQEKEKEKLNENIKYWKTKAQGYEQEKNFLQQQIMDAKRQNKLLKLAIGRLQNELDEKETGAATGRQEAIEDSDVKAKIFLTENSNQQPADLLGNLHKSMIENTTTTAPNSVFDPTAFSKITERRHGKSMTAGKKERNGSKSPVSHYRFLPTENAKFSKFLELIFNSKMQRDDIREEISKYVQALETNYTETIKELRQTLDKERLKAKKVQADRVNENTEKNELEGLFVDCIEEVRKDIMKRRLKNEIYNKKKFQQIEKNTEEAREFEESLLRLAQLAKNRVKLSDFTVRDKCNLLDLFVNNEKTLLKIYEALFPHRAAVQPGSQNTNGMIGGSLQNNPNKERQITMRNTQISNQLGQVVASNYHSGGGVYGANQVNHNSNTDVFNNPQQHYSNHSSLVMNAAQPNTLPIIGSNQNSSQNGNRTIQEFGSFRNSLMGAGPSGSNNIYPSNQIDHITHNIAMRQQNSGQHAF